MKKDKEKSQSQNHGTIARFIVSVLAVNNLFV